MSGLSATYRHQQDIAVVGADMVEALIEAARLDPRGRARFNLHHGDDDPLHEMVIAMTRQSLTMPHRHVGKSESLHLMRGILALVAFNDDGKVMRCMRLGPSLAPGRPQIVRFCAPVWHTVIPLSEIMVVHEVTNGPFVQGKNMEIPAWAPPSDELETWVDRLKKDCRL